MHGAPSDSRSENIGKTRKAAASRVLAFIESIYKHVF